MALEYAILNKNPAILRKLLAYRTVSGNLLKYCYKLALAQANEPCITALLEHSSSNGDYTLVEPLALDAELTQLSQGQLKLCKSFIAEWISKLKDKNAFKYTVKGELVATENLENYEKALFLASKFNLQEEVEAVIAGVRKTYNRNLVPHTEGDWFREKTSQEKTALEYAVINNNPAILEKLLSYRMVKEELLESCYKLAKAQGNNACIALLLHHASLTNRALARDDYADAFETISSYLGQNQLYKLNALAENPMVQAFSLEALAILSKNSTIAEEKQKKLHAVLASVQHLSQEQLLAEDNRYKVKYTYFKAVKTTIASATAALSSVFLYLKKGLSTGDNIGALRLTAYVALLRYFTDLVFSNNQQEIKSVISQIKGEAIFNEHRNTSNCFRRWYANHFKTDTRSKLDELEKLVAKGKLTQKAIIKYFEAAEVKYHKFLSKSK